MKKIVYVVGGMLSPTGMGTILSRKINWLADNTNYELYMILTERPDIPWCYEINPKVKWVNFNINFDELDTMPLYKKILHYWIKQRKYKKVFTKYLMRIRPDITVSALRREINFINDIHDGSKKIGEIHFDRTYYRDFHSTYLPHFVNTFIKRQWIYLLIKNLKRLDSFVVLTHEDFDHWPELDNKIVIPNSIPEYHGRPAQLSTEAAIAVGRYTWQKGFDLLIEAWELVAKKYPNWILNIYGSGDSTDFLNIIKSKGLSRQIKCHPATPDIFNKYVESAFFILSSRYEGLPLVLLEAMSVGLPAVSFKCPCGPSDIISNYKDGLLVDNGNIRELANSIIYMIENKEKRQEFGLSSYKKAQQYYPNQIMKQWINLFESL